MRTIILVSFLTLATVPDEISRLDECIQLRFLDTKAFGMRRILPNQYHGIRTFQPENSAERAAVNELQQKGYTVAFYLAGRNILETAAWPADPRRYRVQGPAFLTSPHSDGFPPPDTWLDDSRRALISFQDGAGYEIQRGEWTVAMRPLRARNERCVQCHAPGAGGASKLKAGDPLGVALYVYKR